MLVCHASRGKWEHAQRSHWVSHRILRKASVIAAKALKWLAAGMDPINRRDRFSTCWTDRLNFGTWNLTLTGKRCWNAIRWEETREHSEKKWWSSHHTFKKRTSECLARIRKLIGCKNESDRATYSLSHISSWFTSVQNLNTLLTGKRCSHAICRAKNENAREDLIEFLIILQNRSLKTIIKSSETGCMHGSDRAACSLFHISSQFTEIQNLNSLTLAEGVKCYTSRRNSETLRKGYSRFLSHLKERTSECLVGVIRLAARMDQIET